MGKLGERWLPSNLSVRLFLAVLSTAVLVAGLVSVATLFNFNRGFLGYLNRMALERMDEVRPRLVVAYREHGDWDFIREHPGAWFHMLRPVSASEAAQNAAAASAGTAAVSAPTHVTSPVSDLSGALMRVGLLDSQNQWVAGFKDSASEIVRQPIRVDGRVVGWLILAPFQTAVGDGARQFVKKQLTVALLSAAVALVLAGIIAWNVSRSLLAPVRRIALASHQLAAGDYDVEVDETSPGEVGVLARDFSQLARTLKRNQRLRRDFLADVSHELRTPLAVLRGELEALEDGIRPFDKAGLSSLQAEVRQLGQLVADLNELALSDAGALSYRMESLEVRDFLMRCIEPHQRRFEQQGLELRLDVPEEAQRWLVWGDEMRLQQLLDNLLENSFRYTDAPGKVQVSARQVGQQVLVAVEDSAPGVPEELLSQLFERLFRVDGSRSRASGGAGLGLAISRNIVQAHGGQIETSASELGGVSMRVMLPLVKRGVRTPGE